MLLNHVLQLSWEVIDLVGEWALNLMLLLHYVKRLDVYKELTCILDCVILFEVTLYINPCNPWNWVQKTSEFNFADLFNWKHSLHLEGFKLPLGIVLSFSLSWNLEHETHIGVALLVADSCINLLLDWDCLGFCLSLNVICAFQYICLIWSWIHWFSCC